MAISKFVAYCNGRLAKKAFQGGRPCSGPQCAVPAQIKNRGTTYSFKCWDESPSGCNFPRGATTAPDLQHRDCVVCRWVYTPNHPCQCMPVRSPSASISPMDSTQPHKVPRPNVATPPPSYVRTHELKHKAAISITMYKTEDSFIILDRPGVTGMADATTVTVNFHIQGVILPMRLSE